jgi:hypothetical protein
MIRRGINQVSQIVHYVSSIRQSSLNVRQDYHPRTPSKPPVMSMRSVTRPFIRLCRWWPALPRLANPMSHFPTTSTSIPAEPPQGLSQCPQIARLFLLHSLYPFPSAATILRTRSHSRNVPAQLSRSFPQGPSPLERAPRNTSAPVAANSAR